jgi:hypothetical protein
MVLTNSIEYTRVAAAKGVNCPLSAARRCAANETMTRQRMTNLATISGSLEARL